MSDAVDPRLNLLVNVLHLEREARQAETARDLSFVFVNDTRQALPFRQAIFWRLTELGSARIERLSNISDLDENAPMVRWLRQLADWVRVQDGWPACAAYVGNDIDESLRGEWQAHLAPYLLVIPLRDKLESAAFGGLLLAAEEPWNEAHLAVAEQLGECYGHAWSALHPQSRVREKVESHLLRHWRRYALGLLLVLLYPMRQYVLVPAEVVARHPVVMAAPMAGVVQEIHVQPNQQVKAGQLLFSLEATELSNRLSVAEKAHAVAQAEYLKNSQQALSCDGCRARLPELQAAEQREQAQVTWAREMLSRTEVRAPMVGLAVFSDINEWRGRPVNVGERVMQVADPLDTRLQIDMPAADAIAIDRDTRFVFYLDVNPLRSFDGKVISSSYEASVTPDQHLAYTLLADFRAGQPTPRLGMRGTAKVYGSRAPLLYYLVRRPVAWFRRTLGI